MKGTLTTIAFLFTGIYLGAQTTDVLFIGNSYTASNNLPQVVDNLALAAGFTMFTDNNTPGGYTLQLHSQDANTQAKINQQAWNVVFVQAQSQEPALDSAYVTQNVLPYATVLEGQIAQNDSCTRLIFYMTWGRKFGDAQNCAAYPPVCTYAGMQAELRRRYLLMAQQNNAAVAPVGEAWKNVLATNPTFDLYVSDGSHPSMHGTYLAACVMFATIYGQSPAGLQYYAGLPAADAQLLQTIAGATVLDSLPLWQTEIDIAVATGITATQTAGYTYNFNLQTTFADAYSWNYGDNTGWQSGGNPSAHTYAGPGQYVVSGVVHNGCFSDTVQQTVVVLPVSVAEASALNVQVFPNPAREEVRLTLPLTDAAVAEWFDAAGRCVMRNMLAAGSNSVVNVSQLPAGVYQVRVVQGDRQAVVRVAVIE
ncbi:MAG: T9SS type A sorting domain-containing protein [Bacteroidia bacterium]|jgi:hypothetical protein|nr:T9SS type A sorting domain-containing protein [Bacteroidia bacterium]